MLHTALNDFDASIQENGNLKLTLSGESGRAELKDSLGTDKPESWYWAELFEGYSCNGSFTPIDPDSHFIGLTSDPYIIGESVTATDSGDLEVFGKVWYFPDYMIKSALQELAESGEVVLSLAFDYGDSGEVLESHTNAIDRERAGKGE